MCRAHRTLKRFVPLLLALFTLALLFTNAKVTADGVRHGLSLCFETLFPSLFPFLILSAFLVKSESGILLGRSLGKPLRWVLGLSEAGATALLLGMLCGFPVGTAAAAAYAERGELSREELNRLALFVNNPSAGFLIGAVGSSLFGNEQVGIALFLITWTSSLVVGIFLRILYGKLQQTADKPPYGIKKSSLMAMLTDSIGGAFSSLLRIFSFVIFFSCITEGLSAGFVEHQASAWVGTWLTGLLEMTGGIYRAVGTLPPQNALRITAFFVGFSGLSICFQLFSIVEKQPLRLPPYLLAKSAQGGLCLLLTELYLRFARPVLAVTQSTVTLLHCDTQRLITSSTILFCVLLIPFGLLFRGRRS